MPAYNAENYLKESIESILNQTFGDFEFIIVEDFSSDNSKKIIKEFMKKDRRIKLVENKKNLGVAKSRTKGVKISRGKYIATFDADDISLPKRLEIQFKFLEGHKDIFLIGGSGIVIDEFGDKIGVFKKFNDEKKVKKKLLEGNPMINSSTMFRNEGKIFYRDKFDGADEHDLFLRFLSEGKRITNISDFLVKYRITPGSITSKKRNKQAYFAKKIQEFYFQREKSGKDEYNKFDPKFDDDFEGEEDYEKIKLNSRIFGGFQEGNFCEVRKNIKIYFKKYGFHKNLILYYILSFFPRRFIEFLRERF